MTVVQTVGAVEPDFDRRRHDAEPRPVGRARHRTAGEASTKVDELPKQGESGGEGATLVARPRPDLGIPRARREVRVRFGGSHRLHATFDAHLHLRVRPVETERRTAAFEGFASLSALRVREEHESRRVAAAQQHDADGRGSRRIGSGQGDRVADGFGNALAGGRPKRAEGDDGIGDGVHAPF